MNLEAENKKRDAFRNFLVYLSTSQELLAEKSVQESSIKQLEDIYYIPDSKHSFRHFYSDIFSILTVIQEEDQPGSIETLGENLALLRSIYEPRQDESGNLIDISENLNKLFDHVSLDIAHLQYTKLISRQMTSKEELENLQTRLNAESQVSKNLSSKAQELTDKAQELAKEIDKTKEKAENAQKEYIAILGIFAAVALTFTGGLAFSTSVFQNMHTSSIYRVTAMALIIGLVLVDSLYILFSCISYLVKNKHFDWEPFMIVNIAFMILLGIIFSAWKNGCVESRNNRIESALENTISNSSGKSVN